MIANPNKPPLWAAGLFGLILGVLAVGPPTGGALVNLDLIAIGDLDVPPSLVGLGSEFPRRAPVYVLWAVLSPPLSAVAATKLWMIATIALATAGMVRALNDVRWPLAWGGAAAYALSPFFLTRIAVGHLGLASAAALLPWAFEVLIHPLRRPRHSFLWLCAFAMCGYYGLIVAGPVVVAGLIIDGRVPTLRQVASAVASQVPWALPAVFSIADATGASGSARFDTDIETVADALRLPIGFGFWRSSNQIGVANVWSLLLSLLLLLVAYAGWRLWSGHDKAALIGLGGFGLFVSALSVLPAVDEIYDRMTEIALFAPLREGQRLLLFTVFALIISATRGLDALLGKANMRAAALAGSSLGLSMIAVTGGALWGLDGATLAHDVPPSWHRAAELVATEPDISLALPWSQYFDVSIADGRRGHHPLPFLLDGDVIVRHDLGLGASRPISLDPREDAAATLVRRLRFGEPIDDDLATLGIAWIVAIPDLGDDDIERLKASSAVETVLDTPTIAVFRGPGRDGQDLLTTWNLRATSITIADALWLVALGVVAIDIGRNRVR